MSTLARWLAPTVLAASLGVGALLPSPVQAGDDMVRVIVGLPDIVFRSGHPYYRHGGYGYNDRLIIERGHDGRPVYYGYAPRNSHGSRMPAYGYGNGYGNGHGGYPAPSYGYGNQHGSRNQHDRPRSDHGERRSEHRPRRNNHH